MARRLDFDLIDYRAEMEEFEWEQARWSDAKLIARSPFRHDNSPSFYVHFTGPDAGTWGDSGGFEDEYTRGGFVKLLSLLRFETTEEVYDYLTEKYGIKEISEGDKLVLPSIALTERHGPSWIPELFLEQYEEDYTYLESRGISAETQKKFHIRLNKEKNSVAIPWRHITGNIANIKYRSLAEKQFFYVKDATPIRTLVYALDVIYREGHRKVYITEAEIDALSLWEEGFPAIALGTSSISPEQVELILKSPIEHLVIGTDDDKAGDKAAQKIKNAVGSLLYVSRVRWGDVKDANALLMKRKGLA